LTDIKAAHFVNFIYIIFSDRHDFYYAVMGIVFATVAIQIAVFALEITLAAMNIPECPDDCPKVIKQINDSIFIMTIIVAALELVRMILDGIGEIPAPDPCANTSTTVINMI
jgi:hypothetical protein